MTKEDVDVLQAVVADVMARDVAMGRVVGLIVDHLVKMSPPPENAPVEQASTPEGEQNNGN